MPTITLKLELHKPTQAKQAMYEQMTKVNTEFANWLLLHPEVNQATSKIFKEFSDEKFPSVIINQTILDVKSQKKHHQARTFRRMWCAFNNQNLKVGKSGDFYTVSFPTLEKRIGVPVVVRPYQQKWLDRIIDGTARQGTAKLFKKKRKWFIAVPITFDVEASQGEKVMGIDLGLRYLAVASAWQVLEQNRCSSKAITVHTYADGTPPDGGSWARPGSWKPSANPRTRKPGG
jgi:putative transposase